MKKTGILGVGAIGSVISSQLIENNVLHLQHFNRTKIDEIKLISNSKKYNYLIDCQTVTHKKQELDWLIICLKEYAFRNIKNRLKNLISNDTNVVVIRNGIDLKEPILPFCESRKILEAMIDCSVQKDMTGTYIQFKPPVITIPKSPLADEFSSIFLGSDTKIVKTEDFKTATWFKLCESTSIGAVTCLTGKPCSVFRNHKMVILYRKILEECCKVAVSDGAKLQEGYAKKMLERLISNPPQKRSSMLSDRLAGKEIEIGAKSGAVVQVGNKSGIATPLNQLVCEMIKNDFDFNYQKFESLF